MNPICNYSGFIYLPKKKDNLHDQFNIVIRMIAPNSYLVQLNLLGLDRVTDFCLLMIGRMNLSIRYLRDDTKTCAVTFRDIIIIWVIH